MELPERIQYKANGVEAIRLDWTNVKVCKILEGATVSLGPGRANRIVGLIESTPSIVDVVIVEREEDLAGQHWGGSETTNSQSTGTHATNNERRPWQRPSGR